jgi:hypothetical protein
VGGAGGQGPQQPQGGELQQGGRRLWRWRGLGNDGEWEERAGRVCSSLRAGSCSSAVDIYGGSTVNICDGGTVDVCSGKVGGGVRDLARVSELI